jgi:hypothetical protein
VAVFYRVRYTHEAGTSVGFGWFTSRRAAEAAAASFRRRTRGEDGSAHVEDPVDIRLTRSAVLSALNRWATFPDNG